MNLDLRFNVIILKGHLSTFFPALLIVQGRMARKGVFQEEMWVLEGLED